MNEELVWKKPDKPLITMGSDPAWVCPVCGKGLHVYGIENIYDSIHECKDCGTKRIHYPWEVEGMSWYYNYYIGIQNNDTKKINMFAPFDSLGRLHCVFSKSRSFASDLYESFYPINDLLTEDAIRKLWRDNSDPESEITEDDLKWIKNNTSYIPFEELPSGDFIKRGYFLLEDILKYEENKDIFDGFWEYLTPTAFNFKLQNEMKYGVPAPKKDEEGYEIETYSCADYSYYAYPDYDSKEYECYLIREVVEMIVPYGLPDKLKDHRIVIVCTQG